MFNTTSGFGKAKKPLWRDAFHRGSLCNAPLSWWDGGWSDRHAAKRQKRL